MNQIKHQPIILIGAARSGTKFLRDILANSEAVAVVPYDVNYIWRYKQSSNPHDCLDAEKIAPDQVEFIRKSMDDLSGRAPNQRLLEKTVSNTLRVKYVAKVFPDAQLVHLIRDGRDVSESAIRQWKAKPQFKDLLLKLRSIPIANLNYVFWFTGNFFKGLLKGRTGGETWGPRFPGIQDVIENSSLPAVCAEQWRQSVKTAHEQLGYLANINGLQKNVYEIRYEELVKDDTAIRSLVQWLGLPDEKEVISAWNEKVSIPSKRRWDTLDEHSKRDVLDTIQVDLKNLGYM